MVSSPKSRYLRVVNWISHQNIHVENDNDDDNSNMCLKKKWYESELDSNGSGLCPAFESLFTQQWSLVSYKKQGNLFTNCQLLKKDPTPWINKLACSQANPLSCLHMPQNLMTVKPKTIMAILFRIQCYTTKTLQNHYHRRSCCWKNIICSTLHSEYIQEWL